MKKNKKKQEFYVLPEIMEMGFEIAIPLVLFVILGVWMDQIFNSKPTFLLLGIGISLFFSGYAIYKAVKKYTEGDED